MAENWYEATLVVPPAASACSSSSSSCVPDSVRQSYQQSYSATCSTLLARVGQFPARVQPALPHPACSAFSFWLQVNIKRVLGLPYGHGTADLVRGRSALVKPSREEVCAEYAGQRHLLLHDVQIQGETAAEPQASELWFGQVSRQTCCV